MATIAEKQKSYNRQQRQNTLTFSQCLHLYPRFLTVLSENYTTHPFSYSRYYSISQAGDHGCENDAVLTCSQHTRNCLTLFGIIGGYRVRNADGGESNRRSLTDVHTHVVAPGVTPLCDQIVTVFCHVTHRLPELPTP
jgi:hypothetical protein